MSVLIIEDNPSRIKLFRRNLIGVPITNVSSANLAIQWLQDHSPRLIFLDYDLHEFGLSIKDSGCGGQVASYLCKYPKRFAHTLVVIHSLNEAEAHRMFEKLHRHDISASLMPLVWEHASDLERLSRGL